MENQDGQEVRTGTNAEYKLVRNSLPVTVMAAKMTQGNKGEPSGWGWQRNPVEDSYRWWEGDILGTDISLLLWGFDDLKRI